MEEEERSEEEEEEEEDEAEGRRGVGKSPGHASEYHCHAFIPLEAADATERDEAPYAGRVG